MNASIARGAAVAAALQVAILAAAAVPAGPARAADATVRITNFTFDPPHLTVTAGTTVTWVNEDDIPHIIASSTKSFRSKTLDSDDKHSFTFMTAGTFEYFCALHAHMTGSIVVEAQ